MSFKYNIDYSNFTAEEMEQVARNMAKMQNKKYIDSNIDKTNSLFEVKPEDEIVPLQETTKEVEED